VRASASTVDRGLDTLRFVKPLDGEIELRHLDVGGEEGLNAATEPMSL